MIFWILAVGLFTCCSYKDVNSHLTDNRLSSIADPVTTNTYTADLKNQQANNYTYDPIGNMKSDLQAGISNIDWTVYGKIYNITNTDATKSVTYTYDPGGQRASKTNNGLTPIWREYAALGESVGGTRDITLVCYFTDYLPI